MPPFRRVEGNRAGPSALGILAPPGRRTIIIVRPRALDWDLVLVRSGSEGQAVPAFLEVPRNEVAAVSSTLHRGLEKWVAGGSGQVEAVPSPEGAGYRVRAELGGFTLMACRRMPGEPYQPMVFTTLDEARTAAARTEAILCPPADAEQELYFNTSNFTR